jgi:predicted DsbA family dithiol-disulfide isomerase
MNFYRSQAIDYSDLLQEAAARTGFSASEMQQVLESELNIDHLLSYITAVVSNRMN